MNRGQSLFMLFACWVVNGLACPLSAEPPPRPNFVILLADDLGYADLGCFGGDGLSTPHLDRMAREGRRLTSFYVAQAVCSASRAGLLTGCYPHRIGILGALGPDAKTGLHPEETTLAELLHSQGYATALFGKWHLGHLPPFLPTRHGFEEYFGLPYSNDMWPHHPTTKFPDLPLIEAERTVAFNPDQRQLTRWYTERAVQFIERQRDRPFFLYVAYAMPHVPLFVSDKFTGRSSHGLYGDVIAEIDWSAGEIISALRRCELEERTLVIFTSDNGPWLSYGNHAGSAGPLREGKGTAWEGGVRVPCLVRWPGQVPPGTHSSGMCSTLDVLPTLARLAAAPLPERPIDGVDMWPLWSGPEETPSPRETFYFYWGRELHAVRHGPWKLHLAHSYRKLATPGQDGQPGKYVQAKTEQALYHLLDDLGERHDVAETHPEVVQHLLKLVEVAREDLGDSLTKRQGRHVRAAGHLE